MEIGRVLGSVTDFMASLSVNGDVPTVCFFPGQAAHSPPPEGSCCIFAGMQWSGGSSRRSETTSYGNKWSIHILRKKSARPACPFPAKPLSKNYSSGYAVYSTSCRCNSSRFSEYSMKYILSEIIEKPVRFSRASASISEKPAGPIMAVAFDVWQRFPDFPAPFRMATLSGKCTGIGCDQSITIFANKSPRIHYTC